jgi:hypothetical protein
MHHHDLRGWFTAIHWPAIARWLISIRMVMMLLLAPWLLTGCIDSDLGIRFDNPNRGEIVQQIQLDESLARLNRDPIQQWQKTIERRVSRLGGQVKRSPDQGLTIKIPFNSSAELETKFNDFFGTFLEDEQLAAEGIDLPPINSQLTVAHSNFLLLERNRLRYEVDLRSLGVQSANGDLLVSPASFIQLTFKLDTPWGARNVVRANHLRPIVGKGRRELIWKLIPGEQNLLESVFWLPNPLGIGTVIIILLVLLGRYLQPLSSPIDSSPASQPSAPN